MSVLVLGGNRYHGRFLVQSLVAEGNDVFVLNRGLRPADLRGVIKQLKADRTDSRTLKAVLGSRRFDVVFDNNAYTPSHVHSLADVLDDRCAQYVFTSTVAVYRKLTASEPLLEEHVGTVADADYPPHVLPYAESKLAAEAAVRERFPGRHTILRLANVFGGPDFAGKLSYFEKRLELNGKILIEDTIRLFSLIHVHDAVRVFQRLAGLSEALGKTVNVADPALMDIQTFFATAYGVERVMERIVRAPSSLIRRCGVACPVVWGPPIEVGVQQNLVGSVDFSPLASWAEDGLSWERRNLAERNTSKEFLESVRREAACIGEITCG